MDSVGRLHLTTASPKFFVTLVDCHSKGIKHCVSSVYYPQANGLVKRFNRSLKNFIQVSVLEGRPLKEAAVDYLGVYRSTPHSTTGVSPAQLLHAFHQKTYFRSQPRQWYSYELVSKSNSARRRRSLTSPVQVSQGESPVVKHRLEDSAAPIQAQGTTWTDGSCREPSTRERRLPAPFQDFHMN
ncbi:uncharacterized protein ISCGN_001758 [Ixodes scapularis]